MIKFLDSKIWCFTIVLFFLFLGACTQDVPQFDPQIPTGELVQGVYIVEATISNITKFRIDLGEDANFFQSRGLGGISVTKNGIIELPNSYVGILWVEVEKRGSNQRTNLPIYVAQNPELAKDIINNLLDYQNQSLVYIARHAQSSIGQDVFDVDIEDWWKSCDPDMARQINEEGRIQAKRIGNGIKSLNIPVHKALSSEFCRSNQTIALMELPIAVNQSSILNLNLENSENPQDRPEIWPDVQELIKEQELSNELLLVVAHCNLFDRNPFQELIGWSRLEGDGFLMVQNSNGNLDFIGPVPNFLWSLFPNRNNL